MNALVDAWGFWGFHAAWQAAIVSAVVLAVVWLGRRWPAPIRYSLLLVALAKFALPPILALPTGALSYWGPAVLAEQQEVVAPVPVETRSITYESRSTGLERSAREDVPPEFAAAPIEPAEIQPMPSPPATAAVDRTWNWKAVLLTLHLSGMAIVGTWLVAQWIRLQRLQATAHEIYDEQIRQRFVALSKQLGMRRTVRLLVGPEDTVPCSFGLVCPVVVVPETLAEEPSEDLDRVLAHELAHHRRGDLWVNAAQLVLFAVWWFHPLYWLLHRSLRATREDCCDDLLLAKGIASPGEYCDTILRVAGKQGHAGPLAIASSMADYPHPLEKRFRRIMDGSLKRSVRLGWLGLATVVVLAALLLPGARRVGEAGEEGSTAPVREAETALQPNDPTGPARLSGRVVSPTGSPVENATISLPDFHGEETLALAKTGPDGTFILTVEEHARLRHRRSRPLLVETEGFAATYVHERHLTLFPGATRDLGDIPIHRGQIFRGRVVDQDDKPVVGARVICSTLRFELGHTTAHIGPGYETVTDPEGNYQTRQMPLGQRCVEVRAEGFRTASLYGKPFEDNAEGVLPPIRLVAEVPLHGRVCDEQGNPIAGAQVLGGWQAGEVASDREGRFVLHGHAESAEFQMHVRMPGYAFINRHVRRTPTGIEYHEVGDLPYGQKLNAEEYQKAMEAITVRVPELVIHMQHEASITGRAIDAETGKPVQLSKIVLCSFTRQPDGSIVVDGCRDSDFDQPEPGTFRMGYTYPDEYHLTLSADGYEEAEAFTPPVTSLDDIGGIVVTMHRKHGEETPQPAFTQRVHGTVSHEGRPLLDGRIGLWMCADPAKCNAENAWIVRGRTTTGDGVVFRSQVVRDGRFDLDVPFQDDDWYLLVETAEGVRALEGPLRIAKGEDKTVEIKTLSPGTICGRVTNFSKDSPADLWVVAFSAFCLQYETPVARDGTFRLDNVYPGTYGLKVGCDSVEDSEVPNDPEGKLPLEDYLKLSQAQSQPWKRAVKVTVTSGQVQERVELEFRP